MLIMVLPIRLSDGGSTQHQPDAESGEEEQPLLRRAGPQEGHEALAEGLGVVSKGASGSVPVVGVAAEILIMGHRCLSVWLRVMCDDLIKHGSCQVGGTPATH